MDLTEKFIWAELKYKLYKIAVNIQDNDYSDNQEILVDILEIAQILETSTP